jgi:hypothetical protein
MPLRIGCSNSCRPSIRVIWRRAPTEAVTPVLESEMSIGQHLHRNGLGLGLVKQQRQFVHLRCTSTVVVDEQERLTRHAWLD